MIVFYKYDYLIINDLERNPFSMRDSRSYNWSIEDDKRLLFKALDRYAELLQGQILLTHQQYFHQSENQEPNYEQIQSEYERRRYMECINYRLY